MRFQQSLISLCLLVALADARSSSPEDVSPGIPFPVIDQVNPSISLEQFKLILRSEVTEEFGGRRLSSSQASTLWESALQDEWVIAHEREAAAAASGPRRRTSQGVPQGSSPFIICDMNRGKPGDMCKATITELVGDNITPLINKADMTCFIVETLASVAENLPAGLAAIPLSPEMKMSEGLAEKIATSVPMVKRVEATFCEGEATNSQQGIDLAKELLQELIDEGGSRRRLRAKLFMESRVYRDQDRQLFWQLHLQDAVMESECHEIVTSAMLEASPYSMTLTLAGDDLSEAYRECLHAVVVDLAMQPEICAVGAYQQMQVRNDKASGIVQSGSQDSKPLHSLGLDGTGQIVAVSDTGVDTDNCYFLDSQRNVTKDKSGTFDSSARKIVQYYTHSDSLDRLAGHGTHVAASLAGHRAGDRNGRADGVAKGAKLAIMDMGDTMTGLLHAPTPYSLFGPGYDVGARIHSASWGTPDENGYTTFDQVIDRFMYEHPDFIFVVAAGNEGAQNRWNTVASPATTKNCIAVGASQNAGPGAKDGPDYLASFSSRGPTKDGRMKPDIVAPGARIESARADPGFHGECDDTSSSGLFLNSGTSMSTPFVSGSAAIIRQYFVNGWHYDGSERRNLGYSPRASLVKAVLLNGADALVGVDSELRSSPYDRNQGFGRVNLLSSLPLKGTNNIGAVFVNTQSISNGQEKIYTVTVNVDSACDAPLSATLVWTDPPAAANCNNCVLNDLDLSVTRRGTIGIIFPNGLNQPDETNNAERVRVDRPIAGASYTIHVKGTQLIQKQNFSLVITGCFNHGESSDKIEAEPAEEDDFGTDSSQSDQDDCEDGRRLINVNDRDTQDCEWLKHHIGTYSFLCESVKVARECPSTCRMCHLFGDNANGTSSRLSADLPLDGQIRWYGIKFDLKAHKNMELIGLGLHLSSAGLYRMQISIREGDLDSNENSPWRTLHDAYVNSNGSMRLSRTHFSGYELKRDTFYTLYVATTDDPELLVTSKDGRNNVAVLYSPDMVVRTGVAVTLSDQGTYAGFAFNGSIQYRLLDGRQGRSEDCRDSEGTIEISDTVGSQSCAWLSENMIRYGHVCDLTRQATFCPKTCNICDIFV